MHNNTRRKLVLIGLEDASGALVGDMAALPVQSAFAMAPQGQTQARDIVRPSMSQAGSSIGAKNWSVTLPVELTGGGVTAGDVNNPPIHPALLASGMVQEAGIILPVNTVVGTFRLGDVVQNTTAADVVGTVVRYLPGSVAGTGTLWLRDVQNIPAATDALTVVDGATAVAEAAEKSLVYRFESDRSKLSTAVVHAHFDGQRRIATRCAGTFNFEWVAGEFCTVQFTLQGVYASPADVALPSATFADVEPPIGESAGLVMGAYPTEIGTIERLTFDAAIDVQPIADINSPNGRKTYRVANRAPVGTINPEVTPLAQFNPWQLWETGQKAQISATLGKVPGQFVSIAIPAPRVTALADQERAGSDVQQVSFEATGTNDDEFYLIFH